MAYEHDKIRYTNNNEGTFDKIVENIHNIFQITSTPIIVRLNLSSKNIATMYELIDYLELNLKEK